MPGLDSSVDVLVLVLRFALLAVLYAFLLAVFLLVRRELRQQAVHRSASPGRLVVVDGGSTGLRPGQALPLQPVTSLGRAPNCTLILDDSFVSATHALLTWRDGRWWLRDAGSTNGTFLNHQPVLADEVPVEFGDVVGVGRLRFKLTR